MTTTATKPQSAASPSPAAEVNVFEFRKTARKRAMICPGAGFDYLGRPVLAGLCYVASVATLGFAIYTAIYPSQTALWWTIALVVAGTLAWWYELFATLDAWPNAHARRAKVNPWLGAGIILALLAVFAITMINSFQLATFDGLHMYPTIDDEERILFHRGVDDEKLQRGTVILFTLDDANKIDEPGKLTLGRIIAVPGDKISVTPEARYVINDEVARKVSHSGNAPLALRMPKQPRSFTIPDGCYYVAQDSLEEGFDSQVLALAKRDRIVSTKLFRFDKLPFLEVIE